ncbi:dipeptide ABC transporter ATP-binding protein [Rhizobium rhizogenes]|uniref:ABC transporter ATP-binding protein n=1 Tax=Rhizobium rhizogenes NBRC 13257 TaxID=1220581 RepID=A0AA87QDQ2_RHIRH|nr:ABC transporter ATP-binding protein [Rhizobium rhizogenes]NTG71430.1 ABC transporter ATP-binding protein [Rhizobium rhizogenes]TRB05054.1 ABC transporter ATP-binding protein [Rhizobium rhizogenes]TRB39312.1 ABC transporter ATP-binding protein [Rhizobium rhizogenes]TRB54590.1 ABC transporter ATP-binding protein [Rhizobium rhizogenes]GAJ95482.1 putative ABC transporter ATP-binding protein [Rhizobium rhizogenes NBRC 13257]
MSDPILTVSSLSVDLLRDSSKRRIVDNVGFALQPGEVLGLVGEAGSGKSVLARAMVNSIRAPLEVSSGKVIFEGKDVLSLDARGLRSIRGNRIGFIGANPMGSLDPRLPIGHQIIEKLRSVRPDIGKAEAKEKVLDLLGRVHIPSPRSRFHEAPFQFSGGMMQRVMIVDALVSEPSLVIADNITQPLDVTVAAQIIRLIDNLRESLDTAFLFISSSLPVVSQIAERTLVMQGGRIVEQGKTTDITANPQQAYTRALLSRIPSIWKNVSAPEAKDGEAVLTVENATRTYSVRRRDAFNAFNEVKAVRDVSFTVNAGENFGIVGESGCGKSTLTRLLAWLEQPNVGRIAFLGKDLSSLSARSLTEMRKSFQLLLQDPYGSLPAGMSIIRMIEEPLLIHGVGRRDAEQRAREAMREVGLHAELADRLPVGLSAGQRQRINIARALVLKPRLLILDETLSALDQVEQAELLDLFKRLQAAHGFSYIFISHDLALVRRICHRVAVMYLGRIVELADNRTLFEHPHHPYTRALLSAMPTLEENRFPGAEYLLDGEPPSPIHLPVGCSFRSRCPRAQTDCANTDPMLQGGEGGNYAACLHRHEDEAVHVQ